MKSKLKDFDTIWDCLDQGGIFTGKVGRIFQRRFEMSQEILMTNHAPYQILKWWHNVWTIPNTFSCHCSEYSYHRCIAPLITECTDKAIRGYPSITLAWFSPVWVLEQSLQFLSVVGLVQIHKSLFEINKLGLSCAKLRTNSAVLSNAKDDKVVA